MAGDYNLVMDLNSDLVNRSVSAGENISKLLVKDNLEVLGLVDS